MRTLRFIVDGQVISKDPNCDFSDLVPGSSGFLQAEFIFSSEWNDCIKVAGFTSGVKEHAVEIKDGKTAIIPGNVLKNTSFGVRVLGKKNEYKLTTNKLIVRQNGGR